MFLFHMNTVVAFLAIVPCLKYSAFAGDLNSNGTKPSENVENHEKDSNNCSTSETPLRKSAKVLNDLRQEMRQRGLAAYIIPMNDENQSEYVAVEDQRIKYISGFSGSAGTVVVTLDQAGLWTDGRYSIQAARQLDSCDWFLIVERSDVTPTLEQWLSKTLTENDTVGSDPRNTKNSVWTKWNKALEKRNIKLVEVLPNLIDESWNKFGRPILEPKHVFILEESFSGKSWQKKVLEVQESMKEESADLLVVNKLVNVAWLFNLRGYDIPYTPVFKSYAVVGINFTSIYVRDNVIDVEVRKYLSSDNCTFQCVEVKNYVQIADDLRRYGEMDQIKRIWLPDSVCRHLYSTAPEIKILSKANPIELMQAVKNPTEIQGMRHAQLRDSSALVDFLSMLEEKVKNGEKWDEIKAANSLLEFRRKEKYFVDESFPAISASGTNGAVIHYRPSPETNKSITTERMYLLDSGAQYLDGTTDVTRTLHFGQPTDFQKECYTLVLIGAIRMAKSVFATYTKDKDFDLLARSALTEYGLDYLHGTGHGIGSFLSVHEGPFSVSPNRKHSDVVTMLPGMFLSDEPGFYYDAEDGFGIRLETILTVVNATTKYNYNNWTYLTFEPVTLVPFERNLIDAALFTDAELKWLNNYHARVEKEVGEELLKQNRTRAINWMKERTKHINGLSKVC